MSGHQTGNGDARNAIVFLAVKAAIFIAIPLIAAITAVLVLLK